MDTVAVLLRYINDRFENPGRLSGTCQLTVRSRAPRTRGDETRAPRTRGDETRAPETVFLRLTDGAIERGPEGSADARVTVDRDLLVALMRNEGALDLRRAEFEGAFTADGRQEIVDFLRGLMRPIPQAHRRVFDEVEALSRAQAPDRVERLDRPSAADVRASLAALRPVVATGLIDDWVALARTPAEFVERFPTEPAALHRDGRTQTMAELAASMAQDAMRAYSGGFVLSPSFLELFAPPLFPASFFLPYPRIWMGRSIADEIPLTALHRDCAVGVLGHLFGKKRFLLYSPDQSPLLYAYRSAGAGQSSPVKPWSPDYGRFPEFAKARPITVDLEPGDVMVTPTGWWHEVYAIGGPVISLSYFSKDPRAFQVE